MTEENIEITTESEVQEVQAEPEVRTEPEVRAEPEVKAETAPKAKDDSTILIGGKPFMNYVTAVVMQFTTKNADEIIIKARGKFISRAVDVAEVAQKRFLKDTIETKGIQIDSEEFQNKEGKDVRVSIIEIILKKKLNK